MRSALTAAALTAALVAAPTPEARAASVAVLVDAPGFGIRIGPGVLAYAPPPVYVPAPAYVPAPVYPPPRVVHAPPPAVVTGPVLYPPPLLYAPVPPRRHWRHAHRHHAIVPVVGYVYPRY